MKVPIPNIAERVELRAVRGEMGFWIWAVPHPGEAWGMQNIIQ